MLKTINTLKINSYSQSVWSEIYDRSFSCALTGSNDFSAKVTKFKVKIFFKS